MVLDRSLSGHPAAAPALQSMCPHPVGRRGWGRGTGPCLVLTPPVSAEYHLFRDLHHMARPGASLPL